jgi:hypothetical protein
LYFTSRVIGVFANAASRSFADVASLRLHEHVERPLQVVSLDRDGPRFADDVAIGAEEDGAPLGVDTDRKLRELLGLGHAVSVVVRDDVVGLAVVRVDPYARKVDVPEGAVERGLRGATSVDADEACLLTRGVNVNLRVVELHRKPDVAYARNRPRHVCDRARRLIQLLETIAPNLDRERRRIAIGEDTRDEASRIEEHLHTRELARQNLSRFAGELVLREFAILGIVELKS